MLVVGASEGDRVLALARALPDAGIMFCIEPDRRAAARAVETFRREGLAARVNVLVGDPPLFVRKVAGPFDLIVVAPDQAGRVAGRLDARLAPGGRILDL